MVPLNKSIRKLIFTSLFHEPGKQGHACPVSWGSCFIAKLGTWGSLCFHLRWVNWIFEVEPCIDCHESQTAQEVILKLERISHLSRPIEKCIPQKSQLLCFFSYLHFLLSWFPLPQLMTSWCFGLSMGTMIICYIYLIVS